MFQCSLVRLPEILGTSNVKFMDEGTVPTLRDATREGRFGRHIDIPALRKKGFYPSGSGLRDAVFVGRKSRSGN
jgi:hypothetical protein